MNRFPANLIAEVRAWPDALDGSIILLFFAAVILLPAVGYWCMVADFRAYLRALKGALILVANHFPRIPGWAKLETPYCLKVLGLKLPCTEADVKRAYRKKAEELHPDRGGDKEKFLMLQRHLEQAIEFVQAHSDALADVEDKHANLAHS